MEERPGLMRRWRRQWKATRMLQNVNVLEAAHAVDQRGGQLHDEVHALTEHRREQRQSLERLLSLPEDTYAANPLLNDPSAIVIQYISAPRRFSSATSPLTPASAAHGMSRCVRGSSRRRPGRSGTACARR